MTKTSVIKYRKLFPYCLNLNYNKCLFIFASRLGHKTVRDNEVPYTDQRGKSYFFLHLWVQMKGGRYQFKQTF